MKSNRILAVLFLLIVCISPLYAQQSPLRVTGEVQTLVNDSQKLSDGRILFKNFKILVQIKQDAKISVPSGWRLLNPFRDAKGREKGVVFKFSCREWEGDLLCWCEVGYSGGEEGEVDDPLYLIRLSGEDLRVLWFKDAGFDFDMDNYLFTPGSLYVTKQSDFFAKIDLKTGEYAWKHSRDPFTGDVGTFKKPSLTNGELSLRDNFKRVLTLDDETGRILKRDYSAVPREPVQVNELLLGAGFGGYTTYEMFQDHVDGLAWLTGGSWGLGILASALDPPREDQSSRGGLSYLAIAGLSVSTMYPAIATIVGYSNNNNDVAVRGCIGLGVETVFFVLWADAKENEEASKVSLRPDFSPRYAGLTLTQSF